ncbi:MAG: DUF1425 domain-containing protein [Propionivibrio sp.]|uniref:DUF1425 domain-containing protein n=1 Tax=Propionivibrio sp. TaxID=2212460 RepID=UPI001A59EF00|nr:DUF1425 domain-containing protein [Propionivibrio sp.]MBL8415005.1 DUF1425 domain-containing protein [Propionivibrio sp.]
MQVLFGAPKPIYLAVCLLALAPMVASGANPAGVPVNHGYATLTQDGSDAIAISDLRATRQDRLLRVQAELNNASSTNRQVYYRFEWMDQQGLAVWDDEPWKPLIVYGHNKQTISVSSPSFKATSFRLVVQNPN